MKRSKSRSLSFMSILLILAVIGPGIREFRYGILPSALTEYVAAAQINHSQPQKDEIHRGEFIGNVVRVYDGDTITVMHKGRSEKIRLYGIDCPELAQAWGDRAKDFTSGAVFKKTVTIRVMDTDSYGRTVADLYYNDKNINKELVLAGLAWAYVHHTEKYSADEKIAKKQRRGLWADSSPQAPWDFRGELTGNPVRAGGNHSLSSKDEKILSGFTGKVVRVRFGDTISVLHNGREEQIRLYGIDCPQMAQSWGERAKDFTSNAVFGKTVTIQVMDIDSYGRPVGEVILNGVNINKELVQEGLAWAYIQFTKKYSADEKIAREKRRGLWADSSPVAPWDFRKN